MKQSAGYVMRSFFGNRYILTYGQPYAEYRPPFFVNFTGAFIWSLLEKETSEEEVLDACYEKYGSNIPTLESDVHAFLELLLARGAISTGHRDRLKASTAVEKIEVVQDPPEEIEKNLYTGRPLADMTETLINTKIAGLKLILRGPKDAFRKSFFAFEEDSFEAGPEDTCTIRVTPGKSFPGDRKPILETPEVVVSTDGKAYFIRFGSFRYLSGMTVDRDGRNAELFLTVTKNADGSAVVAEREVEEASRIAFLYFAGLHDMVAIHSASVYYRGSVWIFPAISGTGKTTHVNFWRDLFGTPVFNGDINLISKYGSEELTTVHAIPWCGTSKTFMTEDKPLEGIILLQQAPENEVEILSMTEQAVDILNRSVSPAWTEEMILRNADIVESLCGRMFICRLHCTPSEAAAKLIKKRIDSFSRH